MCREMQGDELDQWVQFGAVWGTLPNWVVLPPRWPRLPRPQTWRSADQTHMLVLGGMVYVPPLPLARP